MPNVTYQSENKRNGIRIVARHYIDSSSVINNEEIISSYRTESFEKINTSYILKYL